MTGHGLSRLWERGPWVQIRPPDQAKLVSRIRSTVKLPDGRHRSSTRCGPTPAHGVEVGVGIGAQFPSPHQGGRGLRCFVISARNSRALIATVGEQLSHEYRADGRSLHIAVAIIILGNCALREPCCARLSNRRWLGRKASRPNLHSDRSLDPPPEKRTTELRKCNGLPRSTRAQAL